MVTIRDRNTTALATVTAVTDSAATNTWARAGTPAQTAQSDEEIWYVAGAASVTAVTVTVTAASAIAITVLDVAGASSSPLDVTQSNKGSGTTASTGSTAAISQSSEIVVADIGWNATVTTSAATAGYTTSASQQSTASGNAAGEQAAWNLASPSGAQSYGATLSVSTSWTGAIAAFTVPTSPPPTTIVSGFTPISGPVGTTGVVITGSGFTGATAVDFNGQGAAFHVDSPTQISTTVPCGASTGLISVTAPGGTATSTTNFSVTASPTPVISAFSPTSGPVGTSVVITGSGFTCATAVQFNSTGQPIFTVNSDTQVTASVPSGATTGAIYVTTPGGTADSTPAAFTVTTAPPAPHVMVVVMENREYGNIIGNSNAPYINSLAKAYRSATKWCAVQHNSPNDYLDLLSGSNQGLANGKLASPSAATLVDELHAAGIPWKGYMESMPSSCYSGGTTTDGTYDNIHNPFHYFTNYTTNSGGWCSSANAATEGVLPYPGASSLVSSLDGSGAPDFVWVTPNDCDNMHGDGNTGSPCKSITATGALTKTGDTWLSNNLGPVISSTWFAQNGIIILTWDEGTTTATCYGLSAPGGHIATLVIASNNKGGGTYTGTGDHFGTLRGIQETYAVTPLLGGAANTANGDLKSAF